MNKLAEIRTNLPDASTPSERLSVRERNALALLAAVDAVLKTHQPVHRVFSWSSGLRDDDPCPDCYGKAGVHPCGCWADEDVTYSCRECRTDQGGGVEYPCPTVRAIHAALSGESDRSQP